MNGEPNVKSEEARAKLVRQLAELKAIYLDFANANLELALMAMKEGYQAHALTCAKCAVKNLEDYWSFEDPS